MMSKTDTIKILQGHFYEELHAARTMMGAAMVDVYYGDTSSDGYPGLEAACASIASDLKGIRDVWIDEDSHEVYTSERTFQCVHIDRRYAMILLLGALAEYVRFDE